MCYIRYWSESMQQEQEVLQTREQHQTFSGILPPQQEDQEVSTFIGIFQIENKREARVMFTKQWNNPK